MATETLGVCLIGTGRAGMVHARDFRNNVPGARLVALMDQDEASLRESGDELGVEALYTQLEPALANPEVDAVCVNTPTFTHADIVEQAADAGKHVLCEKPLCLSLEEAERMKRAIEEAGVTFMIGFMRRYDRSFTEAKQRVEDGEIGQPMVVKSVGRGPGLPPRWACNPELSNGNLAEVNSHDFDAVRWLTGAEFESVHTRAGNFKTPRLKEEFPDFYDSAIVSFRMDNGVIGTVDGTCPAGYGYDARMEILGTDGVLFIGEVARRGVVVCTAERGYTRSPVSSWRSLFREAYAKEANHFVESIREGRRPRTTLEDGRRAVEVVLAANRSIEEDGEVTL